MDQIHVMAVVATMILFIITLILAGMDKPKAEKIVHMILRLFLAFTLLIGIGLVFSYGFMGSVLIKGALGIILLFLIEMIAVKTRDKENTGIWWVAFAIDLILVVYYGIWVIPG